MPNCPYMEMNLPRCSGSLNVKHLEEAFNLCVDHYELCPLFIELSRSNVPGSGDSLPKTTGRTKLGRD